MWLVVGLGNPGAKYQNNRHNIGFMAVDALHSHFAFKGWRSKFQAEMAEHAVAGVTDKVMLMKPTTYMNESGRAVQGAVQFYKIPQDKIFVFYDDLDLAPGKIKIKQGGGAGGHNGIKSLDEHIGKDYMRVRMGIGHPGVHLPNKAELVLSYVLSDFAKTDAAWLEPLLKNMAQALPILLEKGGAVYLNAIRVEETKGRRVEGKESME